MAEGTAEASTSALPPPTAQNERKATSILVIGMAGSGKTTLIQRLNAYLHSQSKPPYILNLDPAVLKTPFEINIDIRDTINYKEVMKQYNLGPNGGILTALNLFTTKFDQVLSYIEKRATTVEHILIDTPGQIEIFTWSASGSIITDTLASSLPTCIAYIIDTPRTLLPVTFMSNMLYACSILYKTKLPFILVFNKIDVTRHEFALDWMKDFESFQDALEKERWEGGDNGNYLNSLMNSMSLVLEEFYNQLKAVGVSAMTGEGMEDFFNAVEEARKEWETEYKPELDQLVKERDEKIAKFKEEQVLKLSKDLSTISTSTDPPSQPALTTRLPPFNKRSSRQKEEEEEEIENEEEDDKGEIIDRSEHFMESRKFGGVWEDGRGGKWPTPS